MAKQNANPVGQPSMLDFPVKGLDVQQPLDLQPPGTTVEGVNVRSIEPIGQRTRGGQRQGTIRYLPKLTTGSAIQHLNVIVDPQAEALTADFGELPYGQLIQFEWIDDPSTNNLRNRNIGQVHRHGSGRPSGFNINKTPTRIDWPDPNDIEEGTPLSSTQLNAVAFEAPSGIIPIAGTFDYRPASGTVLGRGRATLNVVFTPSSSIYKGAVGRASINVTEASPPPAGIELVTTAFASTAGADTSLDRTLSVATGDFVLVFMAYRRLASPSVEFDVNDSQGNTYTQVADYVREETTIVPIEDIAVAVFYTFATATSSPMTIETTATGSVAYSIVALRLTGVDTGSPIAGDSSNSGSGTAPASVASTDSIAVVLGSAVFGFFCGSSDTSFTAIAPFVAGGSGIGYLINRLNSGSGTLTATATNVAGDSYAAIGVALKPAP